MNLDSHVASPLMCATRCFVSGGGGQVSTTADYLKFCRMLLGRGALSNARLVSPKTLALMTANHLPGGKTLPELSLSLFSEATYDGVGFGLGFAVTKIGPRAAPLGVQANTGGVAAATTSFWIDPAEDLAVIFMTQCLPSGAYPVRRELRTLVYSAINESMCKHRCPGLLRVCVEKNGSPV